MDQNRSNKNKEPFFSGAKNFASEPLDKSQSGTSRVLIVFTFLFSLVFCQSAEKNRGPASSQKLLIPLKETSSATKKDPNLGTQLTFEGFNLISDLNSSGTQLLFSSSDRIHHSHSQVYVLDLESLVERRIAYQDGQAVKPFWLLDKIVYSSTTDEIKERPLVLQKFSGMTDPSYEIYSSDADGTEIERLTDRPGKDQALGVIRNQIYYLREELGITSIRQMQPNDSLLDWDAAIIDLEYSNATEAWLLVYRDHLRVKHKTYEISVPIPFKDSSLIESRWSHSGRMITLVLQHEQKYSVLLYSFADECFKKLIESDNKLSGALFIDSKQQVLLAAEKDRGIQLYLKPIESKLLNCLVSP
jgi:Tol biopolymer transport system component